MWSAEFKDRYNKKLGVINQISVIDGCLAHVKDCFAIMATEIIPPPKAVKVWFLYNGDRKVTYSIKDFRFKAKGLNCPKCNWTSDLNISTGEILCPNCDTLFSV